MYGNTERFISTFRNKRNSLLRTVDSQGKPLKSLKFAVLSHAKQNDLGTFTFIGNLNSNIPYNISSLI